MYHLPSNSITPIASATVLRLCGEAGDGEDTVQKAFALNPDVVLLDVAMPNLNGIDAAEIIKKYLPSATIYFVTQYDSLEVARATAEVVRPRHGRAAMRPMT
jgi:chemotaxis response regulator CheB